MPTRDSIARNLRELGGGLGDLGTLLPLAILLIVNNGLSPVAVFCFVGLHYLITGFYFRIPLPVQPLKAMAVIAIATGASARLIGATGIWMGVILLLLAATDLAGLLSRIFTKPVVRGIQLAVGLFLVQKGLELVINPPSGFAASGPSGGGIWVMMGLAAVSGVIVLGLSVQHKIPATLVILPMGFLVGLFMAPAGSMPAIGGDLTIPALLPPTWNDLAGAFLLMVVPQLPLTFGNSVVSTCHISRDYFGEAAKRVTPRSVCVSLGIGNLIGGFFGAMPCCHGAGGLTAHYSFGARTGRATVFLGALFVGAGLMFGDAVHGLFALIPPAVLGVLLVYVGIEHCMMIRDVLPHRRAAFLALLIGGVALGTRNIALGFAVGMVVGLLMKRFPKMMEERGRLP
ncbi:MAG: putative sulfate/molybdate transporter [Nitrospirota bacterium]|nr:putative sulfate/molybdate transporter [Nitrospirota bacterium]